MNFKTIAIAATATITLGAGIISLAALKKSKQILEEDPRVAKIEADDTTVEEAVELTEQIKHESMLIEQAPKVFKTYGIIALASAAILTGLLLTNKDKATYEVVENINTGLMDVSPLDEQPEYVQAYVNTVKTIAEKNGTEASFIGVDDKGNIDIHILDDDKADDIIKQLELEDKTK